MLSPLDDLPIHQVAQPVRQPGTSDRNFYDRYYFNCHPCSDELFLVMGMGQYPNLGVQDAFALVRRGDEHRVVRASRELGLDRLDTSVGSVPRRGDRGPEDAALHARRRPSTASSYDLTWKGYVPAFQEPPHVDRNANGRAFLDACRLAQLGSWSRHRSRSTARRYDVTPDHWWGSRDRSWGIRPVGEAEAPGNLAAKPAEPFRWLYAPFRMEDHALVFICQERGDGSRVLEEAVRLWPDGGVDHLGRPEHDLQWNAAGPGLFGLVEKGTIRLGDLEVDGRAGAPGPHRRRHRLRLRRRRLEARRLPRRARGPGQGLGPEHRRGPRRHVRHRRLRRQVRGRRPDRLGPLRAPLRSKAIRS